MTQTICLALTPQNNVNAHTASGSYELYDKSALAFYDKSALEFWQKKLKPLRVQPQTHPPTQPTTFNHKLLWNSSDTYEV